MMELPCYHGVMNAKSAESVLRENGGGCFLIRYSQNRKMYILSVLAKREGGKMAPYHFKIKISKNGAESTYEIEGSERKFNKILELLEFYHSNPCNQEVESIGNKCDNSLERMIK